MIQVLPSVLSADFANLEKELSDVKKAGIEKIHIDIMDGTFVPSISLGFPVVSSMRRVSDLFFDVHLMVNEPERYIEAVAKVGADCIGIHVEACTHLHRTIQQIRALNKQVCVILNPATPLCTLDYILEDIDVVLLMTVNPGFGGQTYIPAMTQKIRDLKAMIDRRNLSVSIEVDGGIKLDNAREIIDAGADMLVAGSSIFNGHVFESINEFQNIIKEFYDNSKERGREV